MPLNPLCCTTQINGLQASSNVLKTHCALSVLQHGLIIHISYRVHRGHQNIFQRVTDFCVCYAATFQLVVLELSERWSLRGRGGYWPRTSTLGGVTSGFLHDKHMSSAVLQVI